MRGRGGGGGNAWSQPCLPRLGCGALLFMRTETLEGTGFWGDGAMLGLGHVCTLVEVSDRHLDREMHI